MNWTDYAIIAVLLASCVVGLVRGLLREVISLITWVAAVWLAWAFAGTLEPHLGGALSDEAVRPWAARTIIFVVVLLAGAGIGAIVAYFVRLSIFSSLDRLLGLVFGLLRGAVVLGLLAMLCHAVRLDQETWYRGSTLVPYAEQAGNVLRGLVGERKIRASSMTA
ncbi:MAG TPA: CvpA family protein [Steroidobacteraceae bacterium]|nr:CvpA family protein [Steroidobacteraceae bacterium]